MKKYLITAALAVAISGAFVSCSDDIASDSLIEQKAKTFEKVFVEAYGTPAPDHTWGFKKNNITKGDVITRTAHTNSNQWFDPNYYGLEKPADLSPEEIEYVMNWFSQEREGHGETLDVNDYFVQQVGYGNKDNQGVTYNPSGQVWEKYENGQHVYRTENYTVNSKEHMDWIAANMTSNVQSEEDCDHINNFNTSSGSLMLMKDSETKYGFAFKDSWGTTNNLVSTNYYMVHLVANYKGKHIDGWYVGFDYQTYKSKTEEKSYTVQLDHDPWYEWRTETLTTENVYQAPDGRYNDRVVKIVPAGEIHDDYEETQIHEYEQIVEAGRVFCEDLGASNLSDIDYNDVVFDAVIIHETKTLNGETIYDNYYAKVCLLAAGGTLPVTVGGHEVHSVLSENKVGTNIMINTIKEEDRGKVNGAGVYEHAPVVIDRIDGVSSIDDIKIFALYNNKVVEVTNNNRLAPYKICVPIGTHWAKERVDIGHAYKKFTDYCSDQTVKFWEEAILNDVDNDSIWDDSATPSPFLSYREYREGQLIKHDVVTITTFWNNSGSNYVSGTLYRFGLKGHDSNNDCLATFSSETWNRIKNGTFYLELEGKNPEIRVTNGSQDSDWQTENIKPGSSLLAKKMTQDESGKDVWDELTWTLTITPSSNSTFVNTLDNKHLLFTGNGYRPVKFYYVDRTSVL